MNKESRFFVIAGKLSGARCSKLLQTKKQPCRPKLVLLLQPRISHNF